MVAFGGGCQGWLLALVTVGGALRQRRKSSPAATSEPPTASSLAEHPADLSCFLGSGFGIQKGCQYTVGVMPVQSCDVAGSGEACYRDTPTEIVSGYTSDVRTSFDYSTLTESVTTAEGGGFGVTVSTGFSYMKRSQVSEKSTAFFIGASGRTKISTLVNVGALKLTSTAKMLLTNSPTLFLQFFGSTFVHTLTYGGSFLGSVTVNAKETSDDTDMGAFVGFSVTKGLFSVGGSSSFQNTVNQKTGRVSVFSNANWRGGEVQQDYSSPEAMGNMFATWDASFRQKPAALTVVTRKWIDLVDVQEVAFALPPDQLMLFFTDSISPIIQNRISIENTEVMKVESSVNQALSWLATASNANMRSCLELLRDDISRKRIGIDNLDDFQVLEIQAQFLKSDLSWFESQTYRNRYTTCIGNADKVCDGYTYYCSSWQALVRDDRVDWCLRNPSCRGSSSSPSNELLDSIASIAESRGKDHIGLRDELTSEFPGWEWIVARFKADNYAWAIRGYNFGNSQASYHMLLTGIHCPAAPSCGKCQVTEDCVAESFRSVSADTALNAYNNCNGGYSGTRTVIGVKANGWSRAWSSYSAGRSCIMKGDRHNMYMFTTAPGAGRSVTAGTPAAAAAVASNSTPVFVHMEPNEIDLTPVAMDGSEVLPTDVGDS